MPYKKNCLIVEDYEDLVLTIEKIAQKMGYETSTTDGADKAIELLERKPYKVMFSDCDLSQGSGFDILDYLQENPGKVKKVVLIGSGFEGQNLDEYDNVQIYSRLSKGEFGIEDIKKPLIED